MVARYNISTHLFAYLKEKMFTAGLSCVYIGLSEITNTLDSRTADIKFTATGHDPEMSVLKFTAGTTATISVAS